MFHENTTDDRELRLFARANKFEDHPLQIFLNMYLFIIYEYLLIHVYII